MIMVFELPKTKATDSTLLWSEIFVPTDVEEQIYNWTVPSILVHDFVYVRVQYVGTTDNDSVSDMLWIHNGFSPTSSDEYGWLQDKDSPEWEQFSLYWFYGVSNGTDYWATEYYSVTTPLGDDGDNFYINGSSQKVLLPSDFTITKVMINFDYIVGNPNGLGTWFVSLATVALPSYGYSVNVSSNPEINAPFYVGYKTIINGGFETGDFTGWYNSTSTEVTSSESHSGTYSAQLTSTSLIYQIDQYFIPCSNITSCGFWVKHNQTETESIALTIQYTDETDDTPNFNVTSGSWQEIDVLPFINLTKTLEQIIWYNNYENVTFYIDDVSLTTTSQSLFYS